MSKWNVLLFKADTPSKEHCIFVRIVFFGMLHPLNETCACVSSVCVCAEKLTSYFKKMPYFCTTWSWFTWFSPNWCHSNNDVFIYRHQQKHEITYVSCIFLSGMCTRSHDIWHPVRFQIQESQGWSHWIEGPEIKKSLVESSSDSNLAPGLKLFLSLEYLEYLECLESWNSLFKCLQSLKQTSEQTHPKGKMF